MFSIRFLYCLLFFVFVGCEQLGSLQSRFVKPKADDQAAVSCDVAAYWLCSQPSKSDLILPAKPPEPSKEFPAQVMQSVAPVCENGVCKIPQNVIPPAVTPGAPANSQKNTGQPPKVVVESFTPCQPVSSGYTYYSYTTRPRGLFRRR